MTCIQIWYTVLLFQLFGESALPSYQPTATWSNCTLFYQWHSQITEVLTFFPLKLHLSFIPKWNGHHINSHVSTKITTYNVKKYSFWVDSLITLIIITIKGHYVLQVVIEKTATNRGGLSHPLLKRNKTKKGHWTGLDKEKVKHTSILVGKCHTAV